MFNWNIRSTQEFYDNNSYIPIDNTIENNKLKTTAVSPVLGKKKSFVLSVRGDTSSIYLETISR